VDEFNPYRPGKRLVLRQITVFRHFGGYKNGVPVVNLFPGCFTGILGFNLWVYGRIQAVFGQRTLFRTCWAEISEGPRWLTVALQSH
jgi:hypothetical protein